MPEACQLRELAHAFSHFDRQLPVLQAMIAKRAGLGGAADVEVPMVFVEM